MKALLAASGCAKDKEETPIKAKLDPSPLNKVSVEDEDIERLTTCVEKLNTRRSCGGSPYEPRKFDREDFPGLGDRAIIFSAPVSPPSIDFSVLDQDFFPDLSCFRSKAVLKIRPSTCAWKATTAGLASTTTDALIAGLMSLLIPHGTLAPPTVNLPHSELSLASRPTLASSMFPRCSLGGGTTLGLAGAQNGS